MTISAARDERRQHGAGRQRRAGRRHQTESAQGMFLTMDGPISRVRDNGSFFHILMARPYFEFSGLTSATGRPSRDQWYQ